MIFHVCTLLGVSSYMCTWLYNLQNLDVFYPSDYMGVRGDSAIYISLDHLTPLFSLFSD